MQHIQRSCSVDIDPMQLRHSYHALPVELREGLNSKHTSNIYLLSLLISVSPGYVMAALKAWVTSGMWTYGLNSTRPISSIRYCI